MRGRPAQESQAARSKCNSQPGTRASWGVLQDRAHTTSSQAAQGPLMNRRRKGVQNYRTTRQPPSAGARNGWVDGTAAAQRDGGEAQEQKSWSRSQKRAVAKWDAVCTVGRRSPSGLAIQRRAESIAARAARQTTCQTPRWRPEGGTASQRAVQEREGRRAMGSCVARSFTTAAATGHCQK